MTDRFWMILPVAAAIGCGGDVGLPVSPGEGGGPGGAVVLSIEDGNGQTGTVGDVLPEPLVVSVVSGGDPVPGQKVAFVLSNPAAGRLQPDTAETGDDGRAIAQWVLGTEPGHHQVEARLVVSDSPPPSAVFEASAVAGDPDTVRALSPVGQPGRKDQPVTDDPVVIVLDRFGNPVGGAAVTWAVTAGGGSITSPTTVTGSDGQATVTWVLGGSIGVQKLTATVEGAQGSPVRFSAVVLF